MPPDVPYPIAYWVEPGLLAGEYPLPLELPCGPRAPAQQRLSALLDAGVAAIVDLTEPSEQPPYMPQLAAIAAARGVAVEHSRVPLTDWAVPAADSLDAAHRAIAAALEAGQTTYVHCKAGLGRTGIVVATHLMRTRGLPGDEALAEVARLRAAVPDRRESPLVEAQRAFVRGWQPLAVSHDG